MGKKKEQKEKKEKPLDKWTIKELREEALKVPNIQGVHGMNKDELLALVKELRGIVDEGPKKKVESLRNIKIKVKDLKKTREEEREAGASRARLNILRRKVSRLKKLTRRAS